MTRAFDVILFGATGFTGRLVAEYLSTHHGVGGTLRWAMAGRSRRKLEQVRELIGAPDGLPLIVADAADKAALTSLVRQAKVVISTIGPYQQHGQPLITACAHAGTDYVDLCGEPAWMAQMIPLLQPLAQRGGGDRNSARVRHEPRSLRSGGELHRSRQPGLRECRVYAGGGGHVSRQPDARPVARRFEDAGGLPAEGERSLSPAVNPPATGQ